MDAQKCDPCRLCLGSINGCDEILLNNNHDLVKSIFLISGIEVASDSGQYEYLCRQCHPLLEQCVEFRMTCINNDGVFRSMMSGSHHVEDCNSELQNPVVEDEVEDIKLESVDFDEPIGDTNEVETDHILPHELVETLVETSLKKKRRSKKDTDGSTEPRKRRRTVTRKVECPQCGHMCAPCNLKKHVETHNPIRQKMCCPHCPKEYVDDRALRQHINANHTGEVQYKCDQCGKSYISQQSLNEHHLAVHTDEKRFACAVCGERFARSSVRWYHQRTAHTEVRPFPCEYCDKTFKTKSDLSHHTRFHMGYKKPGKKRKRDTSEISPEQQEPFQINAVISEETDH